jgi:phosphomannomutase
MPLIATISGIRGVFGDGLDPAVLAKYAGAFGLWLRQQKDDGKPSVVVGRDGRVTGALCEQIVAATLQAAGCDVVRAGMATTPTIAMGVEKAEADGAVILSASHNPAEWNALKLLNGKGEFLDPDQAQQVLDLADSAAPYTVSYDEIGGSREEDFLPYHIEQVLALDYVDAEQIRERGFKVVVDGINSVGAVAMPELLAALGVTDVTVLNAEPNGRFAHNPEPLPAHLTGIMDEVERTGAHVGLVVDPDADRLAFVEDGGRFFGEELTQVVAADFLLAKRPGAVATNLSSSRALDDVAKKHGQEVHRSPVGEIHVVKAMQANDAVIGGEGNGGVILPDLHYGRDALAGTALLLQHMAETGKKLSELRADLPRYEITKHKLALDGLGADADDLLQKMAERYAGEKISTVDGVKIDFAEGWVHLRKSNTEPIVRIYTEAATADEANALAERFKRELQEAAG